MNRISIELFSQLYGECTRLRCEKREKSTLSLNDNSAVMNNQLDWKNIHIYNNGSYGRIAKASGRTGKRRA